MLDRSDEMMINTQTSWPANGGMPGDLRGEWTDIIKKELSRCQLDKGSRQTCNAKACLPLKYVGRWVHPQPGEISKMVEEPFGQLF